LYTIVRRSLIDTISRIHRFVLIRMYCLDIVVLIIELILSNLVQWILIVEDNRLVLEKIEIFHLIHLLIDHLWNIYELLKVLRFSRQIDDHM